MWDVAALTAFAVSLSQQKARDEEVEAEMRFQEELARQRASEDEHVFPALSPEARLLRLDQRFRADQERARMREEDRRHRERMVVERRKAAALEDSNRLARRSFLERIL